MTALVSSARLVTPLDPDAVAALLREASRSRLVPPATEAALPLLDLAGIERLLPHRDPFLLVDQVTALDREAGLMVACYDIARAAAVLAGHFPGRPLWPGVLQAEAVAQAGCLLLALQRDEPLVEVAATHILGARFVRPITPGAPVEIIVAGAEDGLFYTVVGQCLQRGEVCSATALSAYVPAT